MRGFGGILAALSAAAYLTAAPAFASPDGKRVIHITATTKNPFVAMLDKTFRENAEAKGMKVTTVTSPFDAALQAQQIDDAVAQKYDMIALVAVGYEAIVAPLTRAKQAGIPVILVNSPIKEGYEHLYEAFVGEYHPRLGELTAEGLLQAFKDGGRTSGKVALVTGVLAEGVAPKRVEGFKSVMAKHPSFEIVAIEDAKWDTALSEKTAGQLLARFSGSGGLDAIYAMADNMAGGVVQAARAARVPLGTKKGELIVVSSNCMKMGMDNIKSGAQYSTATQMPARTGKAAAELAADYFSGKKLEKQNILPMSLITKANLAEFEPLCTF